MLRDVVIDERAKCIIRENEARARHKAYMESNKVVGIIERDAMRIWKKTEKLILKMAKSCDRTHRLYIVCDYMAMGKSKPMYYRMGYLDCTHRLFFPYTRIKFPGETLAKLKQLAAKEGIPSHYTYYDAGFMNDRTFSGLEFVF